VIARVEPKQDEREPTMDPIAETTEKPDQEPEDGGSQYFETFNKNPNGWWDFVIEMFGE